MLVSTAAMLSLHFAIHCCSNLFVRQWGHPRPLKNAPTSLSLVRGNRATGRSKTPSGVDSTVKSVPVTHALAERSSLGNTTWPLVESLVVSMRKISARSWHLPQIRGNFPPERVGLRGGPHDVVPFGEAEVGGMRK